MTAASFQQIDITKTDCGTVSSYPHLCSYADSYWNCTSIRVSQWTASVCTHFYVL